MCFYYGEVFDIRGVYVVEFGVLYVFLVISLRIGRMFIFICLGNIKWFDFLVDVSRG